MCAYDTSEKGACYDSSKPASGDSMQVKFADYSTVGDLSNGVGIGGNAFDSYVIGLTH
jgi:hypothetical protein